MFIIFIDSYFLSKIIFCFMIRIILNKSIPSHQILPPLDLLLLRPLILHLHLLLLHLQLRLCHYRPSMSLLFMIRILSLLLQSQLLNLLLILQLLLLPLVIRAVLLNVLHHKRELLPHFHKILDLTLQPLLNVFQKLNRNQFLIGEPFLAKVSAVSDDLVLEVVDEVACLFLVCLRFDVVNIFIYGVHLLHYLVLGVEKFLLFGIEDLLFGVEIASDDLDVLLDCFEVTHQEQVLLFKVHEDVHQLGWVFEA